MATVNLVIAERSRSEDVADLLQDPQFLSFSDEASAADWAMLGANVAVLGVMAEANSSADVGTYGVLRGFAVADTGRGDDLAQWLIVVVPAVDLALADVGASADLGTLSYIAALAIADVAVSRDAVDFAPAIPLVREPVGDELRGTVNLARNPSLEYDEVDLADWSAEADIALTRTSAAEAWAGTYSGRAAVAAGAGTPAVIVASQGGLLQTGYGRRWVASAALRGDADAVSLVLSLVYSDATTDESDPVLIDAAAERPLNDSWWRYATEVWDQDPTKTLMRLDLLAEVPQHATEERILRIDGVQFEEAVSGGATTYVDGDQGDGYVWTGAPGFSMSVRETA